MDAGLLLLLNFLSVPFIYEAEEITRRSKSIPSLWSILKAQHALKSRWLKIYGIFLILFLALVCAPSASGKFYAASNGLIFLVIIFQSVVWGLIFFCDFLQSKK